MLVNTKTLKRALVNLEERNKLIKELSSTKQEDKFYYEKLILAFWLGLNSCLINISRIYHYQKYEPYLYIGYFCCLILDKQTVVLKKNHYSPGLLQQVHYQILNHFNKNHRLLMKDPKRFFFQFKSIIALSITSADVANQIIAEAKNRCLKELSRLDNINEVNNQSENIQKENSLFPLLHNAKTLFYKKLTASNFLPFPMTTPTDGNVDKIFINASDREVIDGFYVTQNNVESSTVVIALVGHFPAEQTYIYTAFDDFLKLFGSDLFFVNHRNYSSRSATAASDLIDLTQDVVSVVNYFRKKNKQIVLYGMCGGAAQMILAAHYLTDHNVRYKLIIDRFPQKYNHFFDYKTLSRKVDFFASEQPSLQIIYYLFGIIVLTLISLVAYLLLRLTNSNVNFGDIVKSLPQEDVLVLQAKGVKDHNTQSRNVTDIIVHPENDMRQALKDIRHQRKSMLQELIQRCSAINVDSYCPDYFKDTFIRIQECFKLMLQLIKNEKLTSQENPTKITDIHSKRLFELRTRNYSDLPLFVQGFFKTPLNCVDYISALEKYSKRDIYDSLKVEGDMSIDNIAEKIWRLLNNIIEHKQFINYMLNRLIATSSMNLWVDDAFAFKIFETNSAKQVFSTHPKLIH